MSALRGVAAIQDLPPLGDLLAAVEAAVKDVAAIRGPAPAPVAEVFDAGARALARAAREVVDQGRPDPDSQDAQQFAQRLLATFAGGRVVAIESLFYDDAGPHIVQEGTPPQRAASGYERVEMVSQGEFLTAAAQEDEPEIGVSGRLIRVHLEGAIEEDDRAREVLGRHGPLPLLEKDREIPRRLPRTLATGAGEEVAGDRSVLTRT